MQIIPNVSATTRGTQSREPKSRPTGVSDFLEGIKLVNVLPGDDDREFGVSETSVRQVIQRPESNVMSSLTAKDIVHSSRCTVEGDLDVDIIGGSQPRGPRRRNS
jgi:hypothetical protein